MLNPRVTVLIGMIAAAALSRLLPHPPNMTSVTAIALFGGAYFADRRLAFLMPCVGLLLSDMVLGFYAHMEVIYLTFALIVCFGFWLRNRQTAASIAGAALASSVMFFTVTNFATWALGSLYPKTIDGLVACYVAGIPFFQNTLLGDLFFSALLFGGFTLLESRFVSLREPLQSADMQGC
jgi:hypothetical protein